LASLGGSDGGGRRTRVVCLRTRLRPLWLRRYCVRIDVPLEVEEDET
jgi:hypothetical protein